jgi:hypothetical protein
MSEFPTIYQLKVVLLGISPMIWRRLLVSGERTITDLHCILQIAMGWADAHLNRFRIHGMEYGVYHDGGMVFSHDPDEVRLGDFQFRINEKFQYEYDFTDQWRHQIRVVNILDFDPRKDYPLCIGGNRACPPEDCGGPWRFMALRQHYSPIQIMERFNQELPKRLNKFNLEVAPEKTEMIRFSRFHPSMKSRISFLGFETYWMKDSSGAVKVKQRTARKKLQSACRRIKEWIKDNRHLKGRSFIYSSIYLSPLALTLDARLWYSSASRSVQV